jgi:hypothetical protein
MTHVAQLVVLCAVFCKSLFFLWFHGKTKTKQAKLNKNKNKAKQKTKQKNIIFIL